jgi:hypothetical protein
MSALQLNQILSEATDLCGRLEKQLGFPVVFIHKIDLSTWYNEPWKFPPDKIVTIFLFRAPQDGQVLDTTTPLVKLYGGRF